MIKSLIHKLPLLLLSFVIGCTTADNFFGNGIVPPSQLMDTYIDSTMKVRTTIFKVDSMRGNLSDVGILGSTIDPFVGRTTVGFFYTYLPIAFPTDSLFGYKPTLDSMFAVLTFSTHMGDTLQPMKVSLYEIADSVLRPNYSYYLRNNPENYYKSNEPPLAQFEVRGEKTMKVRLPEYFSKRFLMAGPKNEAEKKTNPYFVDSLWVKTFKGLYFRAEPITSGRGQIASINLSASSGLRLHYHNKNKPKFDTTLLNLAFYKAQSRQSIGFAVASHDYSYSNVSLGGVNPAVIGDTTIEAPTLYIQGLDGLGSKVKLDMNHLQGIRAKAAKAGFGTVAIHRAIIRWYLQDQSATNYNDSFKALALYNSLSKRNFISDFNPAFIDQSTGKDSNPLGGLINRSMGYYEQNITSTVQKLISGKNIPSTVELLPIWGETMGPNRSVLGGSASSAYKPEIIITYTLLK